MTMVRLAAAASITLVAALTAPVVVLTAQAQHTCPATQPRPPAATRDIPPRYLALYQAAGHAYGLPWSVLAAIGAVESDHGRGPDPGIHAGANQAGAMGPMQLVADNWRHFAVDGDHDGRTDIYNPADAIFTAAHYLRHSGAPARMQAALFEYNHSLAYVHLVLDRAARYARTPATATASWLSRCLHGAAAPAAVAGLGRRAARVLAFARAQLGKPYVYGALGPAAFDCSGLVVRAYQAAGLTLPRTTYDQWRTLPHLRPGTEQPGDLVFMRMEPGGPGHVGIVLGDGRMIAAPHTGTVVQIQTYRHRPDLVGFARPR
ncbi:C40 family peptidase [Actinomadura rupiterrae]|uniref:C40 family peptidase n=1 Tax=Actinomadura rupiterrae TaxID=559627 RepID=UPI0020A299EC|nr:bifunctional lytic transglycosylase/C40 family peptidase [Actinomadura rupiterrae]MCP2341168.1 cell wall-associated NlpC family hydrolase [Actinomadura rupiterrae]